VFGDRNTAEVEIEARIIQEVVATAEGPDELMDVEPEYNIRCLCPSCFEIEEGGGIPYDLFTDADGRFVPGTYYVRAWHETHPAGLFGPEEYSGGLEITVKPAKTG